MDFRPGWYLIRTETGGPNEGRQHCRHYVNEQRYDIQCYVEPNGSQILQWSTSDPAKYKKAPWSSEYTPLQSADPGDWWDNPQTSGKANPDVPGEYLRENRQPTARELSQRAGHADPACADGLVCSKEIHVGIFFDGTNNNEKRDRALTGHSNIVSLWDAHTEDPDTRFRYYIPGVGTIFEQIGEKTESSDGKTFAGGGEARIHWAMLLVYNAVCRASTGKDLMPESEMTPLVTSANANGLRTSWRLSDGKMRGIFRGIQQRLLTAVQGKRPKVVRINLSVFGFSRGAAQARTFCNWIQQATQGVIGHAILEIRFLGLFDTVASVGLADSSPIGGSGFMDWADGTMEVPNVRRGLHYVAAHEIRRSFPVSTARGRQGSTVAGMSEYIYPGAHSDIGGGYSPRDQGKAIGGRSHLLSQIALNDMHFEAINAGVELRRKDQMLDEAEDFTVAPELDAAFSAYTRWTAAEEKGEDVAVSSNTHVENRMQSHMHLYWRWRASKRTDEQFKRMTSYQSATDQDKTDLWEAELDFRDDVERARRAVTRPSSPKARISPVMRQLHYNVNLQATIPPMVDAFFDQRVHDSHAGFWMLSPITQYDKNVFANEIRARQASDDSLMRMSQHSKNLGDHSSARDLEQQASRYSLNNFERRILALNPDKSTPENPATIPVMTDTDAADLRQNAGFFTSITLKMMGTGTRREANGHGKYRKVFDRS